MKTVATINFKGGVGKTTVTWCLGDVLSNVGRSNVLKLSCRRIATQDSAFSRA